MNKTEDKVGENLEEIAVDLKLNKLSIGSALLNIVTLNNDIGKWVEPKLCNQVPSLNLSRWRTLTLLKI